MEAMVGADLAARTRALESMTLVERELAAVALAAEGPDGSAILRRTARNTNLPIEVRVTALRYVPADGDALELITDALADPFPVIRVVALELAERTQNRMLLPVIERLTEDRAEFWDLDEKIVVGEIAARVRDGLMK